jgi:tetratricopeptide (TPR) repeat protein
MNSLAIRFSSLLWILIMAVLVFEIRAESSELSSLINKADILLEQGSYEAGIAVLETVIKREPENAMALSKLLDAYNTYSQQLIDKGRFDQANNYLTKMDPLIEKMENIPVPSFTSAEQRIKSRIDRERSSVKSFMQDKGHGQAKEVVSLNVGREQYNEAVKHFKKHEYELAQQLLLQSIEYDDKNPFTYELLGEISNLNQDMETAELYYRKAFSLNPDPRVRDRLERILNESQIEDLHQHYSDEHFNIRYRRDEKFRGAEIRTHLREAYKSISKQFGFYPKHKITVVLYNREEFETLYGQLPHWLVAMFDGKIRLPVYQNEATGGDLERFIHHELAHAFVLNMSELKCPVWLNEGLAQYFENQAKPIVLEGLRLAVRSHSLIDLKELLFTRFSDLDDHDTVSLYYLQSFSIVTKLMNDFGRYKMKQLLFELGKEIPFLDAFEATYGRTFWDFAGTWRAEVNQQFSR